MSKEVRGITAVTLDDNHVYLAGGYTSDADGFTADAFVFDVWKSGMKTDRVAYGTPHDVTLVFRLKSPLLFRAAVGLDTT